MNLVFISATSGKQYPDLKDVQRSNAVHRVFSTMVENQEANSPNSSSTDVPDERKNIAGTLGLLELAKWAQEQKWEWKGSPNVGANHDAHFYEAIKETLESDDDDDNNDNDNDNDVDEALEVKK